MMPHLVFIVSHLDYLIQIVDTNSFLMTTSADPDHLASEKKPSDLDIQYLQRQDLG